MNIHQNWQIRGTILPTALLASAIIGLLALSGMFALPLLHVPAGMAITPATLATTIGTPFTIQLMVTSDAPVNAFAGRLLFDSTMLTVDRIDYNTSIADLWAEAPWYNDGDGTISFAGGSTNPGGFIGTGSLVSVTFTPHTPGEAKLRIENIQILQHDGLGTEAAATNSINTIFTIVGSEKVELPRSAKTSISVVPPTPVLDLNGDAKITIADISIFMLYLTTNNSKADFNRDGSVSLADLSILLDAR